MAQFSSSTSDANGIQHLLSDTIRDLRFVDLSASRFANPDDTYTGYAADGAWYTNGLPDPTHVPAIATWAVEGEGDPTLNRGDLDRFPDRLFIVTTDVDVVLINADDLTVWMRFTRESGVSTHGSLLGKPANSIHQAAFAEGVLVIATSTGVRVADFREDVGYWMGVTILSRSKKYSDDASKGLTNRNEDGVLEHATVPGTGASNNKLVETESISLSMAYASGSILAAIGHPTGLSGISMPMPPSSGVPLSRAHEFQLSYTGWLAFDDNDADATTPYLRSTAGDNWSGDGVRGGDTLETDTALSLTITSVGLDELSLTPEISVSASGSAYKVSRSVSCSFITKSGALYFTNGAQKISKYVSQDWYTPAGETAVIDAFDLATNTSELSDDVSEIEDLALSGETIFLGTDIGVFHVTEDDLASAVPASNRYGWSGGSSSTYDILEGSAKVTAVAVDPETGHLFVAATSGSVSVVTEIDTGLQQAFQFFDSYSDIINVLMSYRNSSGPPAVEVS